MRVLLVANRLPIVIQKKNQKLSVSQSPGGVASGLKSFADTIKQSKNISTLWLGWPGVWGDKPFQKEVEEKVQPLNAYPVFIENALFSNYYEGFCNKVVWPLFHYFPEHCSNKNMYWEDYKRANELFCQKIVEQYRPKDTIFIHDYQLLLLPQMVRQKLPDAKIGFFLHIPFPHFEVFRMIPTAWQEKILEGMLGANLVGFHTHEYTQYFLDCVQRITTVQNKAGCMQYQNRLIQAKPFPLGIDYEHFSQAFSQKDTQQEYSRLEKNLSSQHVVLSIDRLDYSKGILNRLKAFELFLVRNPALRKKTTLVLVLVLSRTGIGDYKLMKKQIDEYIGKINGRFGDIDWTPILYQSRSLPFHALIALYNRSDVALVTPFRDGMNLIAKEYIASKAHTTGVLILSELAGAAKELSEALMVNPFSTNEIAEALERAFLMSRKEQAKRIKSMKERLQTFSVKKWGEAILHALDTIVEQEQQLVIRKLTPNHKHTIKTNYDKAHKRLLLLDYDGTLREFVTLPQRAKPTSKIIFLLESLIQDVANDVYIISGRASETLERWFGKLRLGLVAEHGAQIKLPGQKWRSDTSGEKRLKKEFRVVMQKYAERVPGSFIEEKLYSLVYHDRAADQSIADSTRKELLSELLLKTSHSSFQVFEGNKNIELKYIQHTKGTAVQKILQRERYDFIMGIGDDRTDEDMFETLAPLKHAITIKVRFEASTAGFNVKNVVAAYKLLTHLAEPKSSPFETKTYHSERASKLLST